MPTRRRKRSASMGVSARAARRSARGRETAARLTLVLGGSASGKSDVALNLAGESGPRLFLATGEARDPEMAERIARHRETRDSDWDTAEVPLEVAAWIATNGRRYKTILLDCLTLWLSNLLEGGVQPNDVPKHVVDLLAALRASGARVVLVSNELGMGLVPMEPESRRFRDLAGRVNQLVAAAVDEVVLVVAGVPLRVKTTAPRALGRSRRTRL